MCLHLLHSGTFKSSCLPKGRCYTYWCKPLSLCVPWRRLIPACDHHDSVMTLRSACSHLCVVPHLPLSIRYVFKKLLTHPLQQLKKQHCWRTVRFDRLYGCELVHKRTMNGRQMKHLVIQIHLKCYLGFLINWVPWSSSSSLTNPIFTFRPFVHIECSSLFFPSDRENYKMK